MSNVDYLQLSRPESESHTSPIQLRLGIISRDRLENRIVKEQIGECSKLVSQSGIEQRRAELQDSAEIEIMNVLVFT